MKQGESLKGTVRRPTTEYERMAISQMKVVCYPVGSWDKRFMRNIGFDLISEKESAQLWRIFIRYRRQMGFPCKAELLRFAQDHSAPDFRKQQAAAKEQAQLTTTQ